MIGDILWGLLIIAGMLVVMGFFWYLCYRINIRLESNRKYHETKAKLKAVDESETARRIAKGFEKDNKN